MVKTDSYLKIVCSFESDAEWGVIKSKWLLNLEGGLTGVERFDNGLQGFLNSNFSNVIITSKRTKITEGEPKKFSLYHKVTWTGDLKNGRNQNNYDNSKDSALNALKGVFNSMFNSPPVQYRNVTYHIHKSTGSVNE